VKLRHALLLLLISISGFANASHIVGGGFNIVWLHDSTYQLTLRILRDCSSQTQLDKTISVGIFDKQTDLRQDIIIMDLGPVNKINFISVKCMSVPSGVCTELGSYTKVITLSPKKYNNSVGYYISWERCCRNNIISNITNPGNSSMAFYMEIPPPKLIKNSSPSWNNNPKLLLCVGNPFTYNFNFTDPDGDSLVYSLVDPLQGNLDWLNNNNGGNPRPGSYPSIQWSQGFNTSQQITGSPPLTIDSRTGQITVTPDQQGTFVTAIKVEEYRFGKKLGEVHFELQFTVSACNTNQAPVTALYDTLGKIIPGNVIYVQVPNRVCFDIVTTDTQDSIFVDISGNLLDSNKANMPTVTSRKMSGMMRTSTRFCWQTTCEQTGMKPQKFSVYAIDNGCPLPKSSQFNITVNILPMPLVNPTRILCMSLVDNKETYVYWGDSTGTKNPYFRKYNLYRGINYNNSYVIDTFIDKSIRQFDDKNTPDYAKINYTYFMRGVNLCGFEGPASDTMGTFDQLKFIPDQQKFRTVTVDNNNHIKIAWPPTKEKDFAEYVLYKSTRDELKYQYLKTFLNKYDTVYNDFDVDVNNTSYCYYLEMKDTCQNVGPMGQVACSILLKGKSNPFEHSVNWNSYNYWENGTQSYTVFRKSTVSPYTVINILDTSVFKYLDDKLDYETGDYNYFVEATEIVSNEQNQSFNAASRSNEIELKQAPLLHIPNAFTANNDGINDDWGIQPVFVKNYSLDVYNRWGQRIFHTTDKHQQWKGEGLSGEKQQNDVYVYVITYSGWDDSYHVDKGNVTLLR